MNNQHLVVWDIQVLSYVDGLRYKIIGHVRSIFGVLDVKLLVYVDGWATQLIDRGISTLGSMKYKGIYLN